LSNVPTALAKRTERLTNATMIIRTGGPFSCLLASRLPVPRDFHRSPTGKPLACFEGLPRVQRSGDAVGGGRDGAFGLAAADVNQTGPGGAKFAKGMPVQTSVLGGSKGPSLRDS